MKQEKPIKVLHVFGFFDKGGAESMAMNLFKNIDRDKVEFGFVVHGEAVGANEKEVLEAGAEVFRVPEYTGKNHFQYREAWKKIFREHPEYKIIHSHVRSTANIFFKIANKYGLTTIAHSHNTSSGSGLQAVVKNFFQRGIRKHADEFIGCSKEAGEWLFGETICSQDNFHVLNNAIKASDFAYNEKVRHVKRNELNVSDKIVIGHIGRFYKQKNHEFLIDIFNEVYKRANNVELILVGEGDTERKQLIEKKVLKLGLEDSVKFLGIRSDISELLQAFDVFLFPSFFEGLPVTLVETQAAGLPALVTNTISKDIQLTTLISYLSLNDPVEKWATQLLEIVNNTSRENTTRSIKEGYYDIETTSLWYQNYIIELSTKK